MLMRETQDENPSRGRSSHLESGLKLASWCVVFPAVAFLGGLAVSNKTENPLSGPAIACVAYMGLCAASLCIEDYRNFYKNSAQLLFIVGLPLGLISITHQKTESFPLSFSVGMVASIACLSILLVCRKCYEQRQRETLIQGQAQQGASTPLREPLLHSPREFEVLADIYA